MFTVDKNLNKKHNDKTVDTVLLVRGDAENCQKVNIKNKNTLEQKVKIKNEEQLENVSLFEIY